MSENLAHARSRSSDRQYGGLLSHTSVPSRADVKGLSTQRSLASTGSSSTGALSLLPPNTSERSRKLVRTRGLGLVGHGGPAKRTKPTPSKRASSGTTSRPESASRKRSNPWEGLVPRTAADYVSEMQCSGLRERQARSIQATLALQLKLASQSLGVPTQSPGIPGPDVLSPPDNPRSWPPPLAIPALSSMWVEPIDHGESVKPRTQPLAFVFDPQTT